MYAKEMNIYIATNMTCNRKNDNDLPIPGHHH